MVAQLIGTAAGSAAPFSKPCAAHRLGPAERKGLSVQVLAGQVSVTDLSRQHGVSQLAVVLFQGRDQSPRKPAHP